MPAVKVGDINMYYEIHGNGEPLVLINGLGADISRWFRIIPVLSQKYQVLAFDNRGAGQTDKPDIPYTMEMMADDVAGLLEALNIDTAHIFGVSMGGMIAQHLALRHPKMVAGLILGCTRCGGPKSVYDSDEASRVLDPELTRTMTAEQRTRALLPFLWSQKYIENNPDIVEEQVAAVIAHPVDPIGYTRQKQAADGHDTYDRLAEISAPTLIIAGEDDRLIPVENSHLLASKIPNAEIVILKKAGHGFTMEAFDESNRTVLDFLRIHPVRGR